MIINAIIHIKLNMVNSMLEDNKYFRKLQCRKLFNDFLSFGSCQEGFFGMHGFVSFPPLKISHPFWPHSKNKVSFTLMIQFKISGISFVFWF